MSEKYRFSIEQLSKLQYKDLHNLAIYCQIKITPKDTKESLIAKIWEQQSFEVEIENVSVRIRRIRESHKKL
jgi:hypothetical protein